MTWEAVARKDFQDAIRSKTLWAVSGLFVLLALAAAVGFAYVESGGDGGLGGATETSLINLILFLRTPVGAWLVPITALLVGYKAIAGERESGSLKLLLSLPHDRRDVVIGKIVGRTGVTAVAIVLASLVAGVAAFVLYSTFPVGDLFTFTVLTVVLATAFTSIAVGFSAFTASTSRAAAGAIGTFVFFRFVWGAVPGLTYFLLNGRLFPRGGEFPAWYFFLQRVSPSGAFSAALSVIQPGQRRVEAALGGEIPAYLSWWFALGILLVWILLPAAVGYFRFRSVDL